MVDERDEQYNDPEEGEYHFSDDQVNYDVEAEEPKKAKASVFSSGSAGIKGFFVSLFTKHRKAMIGVGLFLALIVVAYKMVMPSSTAPSTDFAEDTMKNAPVVAAAKEPAKSTPPQAPAAVSAQATPAPAEQPAAMPQQQPMTAQAAPAAAEQAPVAPTAEAQTQPLSPIQQAQASMQQQGANVPSVDGSPMPAATEGESQPRGVDERLASLEQQNAAMVNLLQTEYAQKISDYETQSTASRGKMEELTKRLNRMEAALNQITQLLQNGGQGSSSGMVSAQPSGGMMESSQAEPAKAVYSVQAIIPGRAWLKSDAGDTVTVAEGDVLRSYGRVTKIDPYDGIVNIDTGHKVITLSYGVNAE